MHVYNVYCIALPIGLRYILVLLIMSSLDIFHLNYEVTISSVVSMIHSHALKYSCPPLKASGLVSKPGLAQTDNFHHDLCHLHVSSNQALSYLPSSFPPSICTLALS